MVRDEGKKTLNYSTLNCNGEWRWVCNCWDAGLLYGRLWAFIGGWYWKIQVSTTVTFSSQEVELFQQRYRNLKVNVVYFIFGQK
jgi:hypothetical protein